MKWYEVYEKIEQFLERNQAFVGEVDVAMLTSLLSVNMRYGENISVDDNYICKMAIDLIKDQNTITNRIINKYFRCCIDRFKKEVLETYNYIKIKVKETKIQISFAGDSDLSVIKDQLQELVKAYENEPYIKFCHCFLPREVVISKGFDTGIVDLLDEVLGDKQLNYIGKCKTFEECMEALPEARERVAKDVYRIHVLGTFDIAKGVKEEIRLSSNDKVILV